MRGILLAAAHSSAGKTVMTAALLRALHDKGEKITAVKTGPDYIDPQFLRLANGGKACYNMDLWAMSDKQAIGLAAEFDGDFVLAEGVMGLFDGSKDGKGSSADVAAFFGWPVVLVIDATAQGETLAAIIKGLRQHRSDIHIAGVIFNRLHSATHVDFIRRIMQKHHADLPILGFVEQQQSLRFESRHLGLRQALEDSEATDAQLNEAAARVAEQVDLEQLISLAQEKPPMYDEASESAALLSPPACRHIAIAKDEAFSFIYDHLLLNWQATGAEISFFSPLRDEAPPVSADMIFLPGGYPELHAKTLSDADNFRKALTEAHGQKWIYGECGGYMVMGDSLTDFEGMRHKMLGLLPLQTSFAPTERHLGYRRAELLGDSAIGREGAFKTHEFHHAKITLCDYSDGWQALWRARDSLGKDLGTVGHRKGKTCGSFLHVIAA